MPPEMLFHAGKAEETPGRNLAFLRDPIKFRARAVDIYVVLLDICLSWVGHYDGTQPAASRLQTG